MTSSKLHNAKYELLPNIKRPKYSTIQIILMLISMIFLIIFLIILCYVYHNFTNIKMQMFERPQRSLNSYYYFKKVQSERILKTFFNSNYTSVVYLPIDNLTVLSIPNVDSDPDSTTSTLSVSHSNPSYKLVCYFIFTHDIDQLFRNFEPDLCTHLNIGFFGIENHQIVISDQQKEVLKKLQSFKEKNSNLKTLLTIGGAGEPGFPEMIFNHSNRKQFIASFVKVIHEYQLNGVDLDWEFPSWDNDIQDKRQKQHFTQLLEEIRAEIDRQSDKKRFLLSVAVGSIPSIIDTAYDVQYLNQFVDYINIMCYDYHMFSKLTPWTGINAPLYPTTKDQGIFEIMNINYSANYWISRGMDRAKIVIGLPTYGHSFKLMNILNNDLQAPSLGYGDIGQLGYVTYSEVCKFLNGFGVNLVFDLKSQSPYAYQGSNWISYENEHSLTFKTEYIKSNNFGGVMLFNLNSDNFHGRYCDFKNIQSLHNSTNLFHLTHTVKNTLFDDSL